MLFICLQLDVGAEAFSKAGSSVPGEGDGVNGAMKGEGTQSKDSQKGSELDCRRTEELVVSLPVLYFIKSKYACLC